MRSFGLILFSLIAVSGFAQTADDRLVTLLGKSAAYWILPPKPLASNVLEFARAGDSNRLIVLSTEPFTGSNVVKVLSSPNRDSVKTTILDVRTGQQRALPSGARVTALWSGDIFITQRALPPKDNKSEPTYETAWFRFADGRSIVIPQLNGLAFLSALPGADVVVAETGPGQPKIILSPTLGARTVRTSEKEFLHIALSDQLVVGFDFSNKPRRQFVIDLITGSRRPLTAKERSVYDSVAKGKQARNLVIDSADAGTSIKFDDAKETVEPALLSAKPTPAELLRNQDQVAYLHQGVLLIRDIAVADKKLVEQLIETAKRNEVMQMAKQIGLALIMMAADNDDNLPRTSEFDPKAVSPYLKKSSALAGFTYTFAGGNLANVENPGQTEVGYITGSGGRAVIRADGSVRWVPN